MEAFAQEASDIEMSSVNDPEDDIHLMIELGYGVEAEDDRPMSPTSLVFPSFTLKTAQQLQDYI